MRMKTFGAVVCLAISAALVIPEALTAQTSDLTKQQIESVWRAHLGSFPQDPNEEKALAQQLEAINAKGQQVIECYYGVPGQIYSYVFWHKSAPDGIRQILKSLRSGEDHPFWTLGTNAIDVCPGTRESARKLLADSRAGVQSNPSLAAAGARPTPARAAAGTTPGAPQRGQPAQPVTLLKVAPPKIKDVAPEYPEKFRKAGIKASYVFEITIGPDGRMTEALFDNQASIGPPLFWDYAIAAMRQWVYDVRGLKPPVKFRVTVPFGSSTS